MSQWFYFDKNGQKVGPIDSNSLKKLAEHGTITPDTIVMTETGQSGKAGGIKGLVFSPSISPVPPNAPVMPPALPFNHPIEKTKNDSAFEKHGLVPPQPKDILEKAKTGLKNAAKKAIYDIDKTYTLPKDTEPISVFFDALKDVGGAALARDLATNPKYTNVIVHVGPSDKHSPPPKKIKPNIKRPR